MPGTNLSQLINLLNILTIETMILIDIFKVPVPVIHLKGCWFTMNILVTGGAGYIGSHTCVALLEAGHSVIVADNLCNSKAETMDKIKQAEILVLNYLKTLRCLNIPVVLSIIFNAWAVNWQDYFNKVGSYVYRHRFNHRY